MSAKWLGIEEIHKLGDLAASDYGEKASQLRSLTNLGLPVPKGFFISKNIVNESVNVARFKISGKFTKLTGLYALRASPSHRDWGSIDAILNLGMNDRSVQMVGALIGKRAAFDIYRRFINNFGISVFGLDPEVFENIHFKRTRLMDFDDESLLDEDALRTIVEYSKEKFRQEVGSHFPQSLAEQLDVAFLAMSKSWYRPSAKILRNTRGAPDNAGVGIILQKMVLGIGNSLSGSGCINMIDRETGEEKLSGYFIPNSYGNDDLNRLKTTHLLSEHERVAKGQTTPSLEILHPASFKKIKTVVKPKDAEDNFIVSDEAYSGPGVLINSKY